MKRIDKLETASTTSLLQRPLTAAGSSRGSATKPTSERTRAKARKVPDSDSD